MLTRETVNRIRELEGGTSPVLSVYLGLRPEVRELRSLPARIKELLAPIRDEADAMPRSESMALRSDLDRVLGMTESIAGDLGRGVAIFLSTQAGIEEYVSLPVPVRDRAVVDVRPYVAPLDAMLAHYRRYCAVVIDRRKASIFRFQMGELESWEEMAEEEIRKSNFGGFAGYDEHRVRNRADEIAHRHYRDTAARLVALERETGFDLLLIGGPRPHIEGLMDALPADLAKSVAGSFAIDPATMTPSIVRDHCRELADLHDARHQRELVSDVLDRVGARDHGAAGMESVVAAANQKAVDLLLVQAEASPQGHECTQCGWLGVRHTDSCPVCGGTMRKVPDLVDSLAHSVRAAGGTVEYVLTETPLAEHVVGAILRFPVTAAV